ncbi:MAG: hypothetical protein ABI565_12620, partial [Vicinamibacteria bacterium]
MARQKKRASVPASESAKAPESPAPAPSRWRRGWWIGLFVLGMGAAFLVSQRRPSRPNVLLVTIDTLRADHVGVYGYKGARTPVLDALA